MSDPYLDFLREKIKLARFTGFDVSPEEINPALKPHTRDIVRWMCKGGCRAVFASFGLHKTATQLEFLRLAGVHRPGLRLQVLPLGVRQEFFREVAERFTGDHAIKMRFIRSDSEIGDEREIYLTNYESVREGKLTPSRFRATSLDEASILRSFGSKTYQEFLPAFAPVEFKAVATATPDPNRYKELIHYAGYLGVMDTGQALTRFFQRDSEKAGNLTLYPHKIQEFWLWVASWAVFITKPSDLGHSDDGYVLPPLDVRWHEIPSDYGSAGADSQGQQLLIQDVAMSLPAAAREKRASLDARIERLMEIVDAEGRSEGLPGELSPAEQDNAAGEAAGPQQGALRGQAGHLSDAPATSPVGCSRADAGELRSDLAEAGLRVPDLRTDAEREQRAVDRPLPRDGRCAGDPVQAVQLGAGLVQREPGSAGKGGGVPEHGGARELRQMVIWCDLNDEQRAIERALDSAGITYASLDGTQTIEVRERLIDEWRAGQRRVFVSKTSMYGSGVNLQQCSRMVFVGIHYKFNDLIQAVHRIHRFQQLERCLVAFIFTEAERHIREEILGKWTRHDQQQARMAELVRTYGLDHLAMQDTLARTIGVQRRVVKGAKFEVAHNDAVAEARLQPENSVDLIVTSIPFANHYEYTPSFNDFGHTESNDHFWAQMDFLTPELVRMLKPGRVACIHVKDRVLFQSQTGFGAPTMDYFHEEAAFHLRRHGLVKMCTIVVTTDVVRENNQTYRLGYSEMLKDGTKMGTGCSEYVLVFRKPQTDLSRGYADEPVAKRPQDYSLARWQVDAHNYWRSSGDRLLTAEEMARLGPGKLPKAFAEDSLKRVYDYGRHVAIGEALAERDALPKLFACLQQASPDPNVWTDVTRMRTLNGEQANRSVEKHVCPLQFDIVDRLIERFSNRGDLVYDPFHGLGTVGVRAIKLGRRAGGSELNESYFADQVHYLMAAEREASVPSLFDLEELAA